MSRVLDIEGLTVGFETGGRRFDAVREVDLALDGGEVLALVGESGSGKSVTALAVMGLLPEVAEITAGTIRFEDRDLARLGEAEMAAVRGARIGLIFQEPMTSLNPTMRVGPQVAEVLRLHKRAGAAAARRAVEELFALVRIPDPAARYDDFPHQMSGGMRQRVVIALALACRPALLIADEPTTALDVTTQAQILELFRDLQREIGQATILITHDLAVVAETAHRVAVMYAGRIVEESASEALFAGALHPYTRGLLRSIPVVRTGPAAGHPRRLVEIPGTVPPPWDLPQGCAFAPRCPRASARCRAERPPLMPFDGGRRAACWHPHVEREDAA
ncbi:ABC transporter ATP-binding protein [Aquibium sp. A9E412]|uniref:ABC transporter ATP-binding protein n=1 Tax=Aquibium sp. A9E412 TaxID=2976767 RepID=UPI0025AFC927|nr:ABC transporter ATP-binding protein [Aquibium sp. A9E412]MDN2566517.1 ABC transporter ATP-binding protein [Aquibium sp. A9E412]